MVDLVRVSTEGDIDIGETRITAPRGLDLS